MRIEGSEEGFKRKRLGEGKRGKKGRMRSERQRGERKGRREE